MGTLQGRQDSFRLCKNLKGIEHILIVGCNILGPSYIFQEAMLGPNGRVVKTC